MERTVNVGTKEAERKPVALRSGDALGEVETVARMVGGMKVAEGEREAVEECERKVSVAATEAETLGHAVWETVGDRERTVSVAAGEAVPALGLAEPNALAVPPRAGEAVLRVVGGMKEKEGVKEAVVECERMVIVAATEAETLVQEERVAVEECERTVAVASAEAVPAMGLPVPTLLLVGEKEALGEEVLVPEGEELPEALTLAVAVARMVGGMKVSEGDTVGVCVRRV